MKVPILLLLAFITACFSFAQPSPTEAIVGKAGKEYITEDRSIRRVKLVPGLYRTSGAKPDEEKLMVYSSIVAEKLIAQEAVDRGIDSDSLFLASVTDMEKRL